MDLIQKLRSLKKGKKGVSEVVAVLVLVAVVIVGAIGVGVIMNGFSSQVSDQASADGIADGAATELTIAGSTTVQPLSECLGKIFMKNNKGVRVVVSGGGSGAGIASVGLNAVDIGSASRDLKTDELAKYPSIQTHKIGGSAVVVIASDECEPTAVANKSELRAIYSGTSNSTAGFTITKAYERSEASGTEETFAAYLGLGTGTDKQLPGKTEGKIGNQGVLDAVKSATSCVIGFVDYGFAVDSSGAVLSGIKLLNVTDANGAGNYAPTRDNILAALKGDSTKYPNSESNGLTRPLNYLTNGAPSVIEQKFIDAAKVPGDLNAKDTAANCFTQTGYFAAWQFA